MGSYQTCPKCKGVNSKHFEICKDCNGISAKKSDDEKRDIRKLCLACRDTGTRPCYSCDGKGIVFIGSRP